MLGKQIIELDNYEKCWIGWLITPYKVNQIKYLVKRRYGEDGKFEHISVYFINDYLEDNGKLPFGGVSTTFFEPNKYFKSMEFNKFYTPVETGLYYET